MADQCIVCLENLDVESANAAPLIPSTAGATSLDCEPLGAPTSPTAAGAAAKKAAALHVTTITNGTGKQHEHSESYVARIEVCGHMLHDTCLREWSTQANSCPICRQAFHRVDVYDKVGGSLMSSYTVNDKKQVAEFDIQTWLNDNPEDREEEQRPCPVCNLADREEVLLLCDGCDAPYHTHCIGLESVPDGHWFCMECSPTFESNPINEDGEEQEDAAENGDEGVETLAGASRRNYYMPRTRASMRRVRRRARSDEWSGAWGQIAGHVFDALDLDLDLDPDNQDDDEESVVVWNDYRRSQQLRAREFRDYQRWQQRLNIASRLGARDVFENHLPATVSRMPRVIPAQRPQVQETRDERRAWGALEKARESLGSIGNGSGRKRKSRSSTAEPQPQEEPERKLKRPRARRLQIQNGESSSSSMKPSSPPRRVSRRGSRSASDARSPRSNAVPSFLNSLLKEVEMGTPSEEESSREYLIPVSGGNDGSPATSPAASGYSSPRATSITPPPQQHRRPTSPSSTLSSHIEPIYPRANYSPQRPSRPKQRSAQSRSPESSDSETRVSRLELRQPQPRRAQQVNLPRTDDLPPAPERATSPLPLQTKEAISRIVRGALRPHWKSAQLTEDQYSTINRSVSHQLYRVANPTAIDDEAKKTWEEIATKEVDRAVADLRA